MFNFYGKVRTQNPSMAIALVAGRIYCSQYNSNDSLAHFASIVSPSLTIVPSQTF